MESESETDLKLNNPEDDSQEEAKNQLLPDDVISSKYKESSPLESSSPSPQHLETSTTTVASPVKDNDGNTNNIETEIDNDESHDATPENSQDMTEIRKDSPQGLVQDGQLEEANGHLKQELQRLREHCLGVEESYTEEIMKLSDEISERDQRIQELEDHLAAHSRDRLDRLVAERDHALRQLSNADDQIHKLEAGVESLRLVNLTMREEMERKLAEKESNVKKLVEEEVSKVSILEAKLRQYDQREADTKIALEAATRLSDQLDQKEILIGSLKQEIAAKCREIERLHQEILGLKASMDGKLDKQVIKNLVLGYIVTPDDKRYEVERVLAKVLDFNQEDLTQVNEKLRRTSAHRRGTSGSWISSFLSSGVATHSGTNHSQDETFVKQFIHFLDEQSSPQSSNSSTKTITDRRISSSSSVSSSSVNSAGGLAPSPSTHQSIVNGPPLNPEPIPVTLPISCTIAGETVSTASGVTIATNKTPTLAPPVPGVGPLSIPKSMAKDLAKGLIRHQFQRNLHNGSDSNAPIPPEISVNTADLRSKSNSSSSSRTNSSHSTPVSTVSGSSCPSKQVNPLASLLAGVEHGNENGNGCGNSSNGSGPNKMNGIGSYSGDTI